MSTGIKTHRTKRAQTSKLHRGVVGEPSIHSIAEQIEGFKCTETDPSQDSKNSEVLPNTIRLAMFYSHLPKTIKAIVSLLYFTVIKIQKRLTRPCNP